MPRTFENIDNRSRDLRSAARASKALGALLLGVLVSQGWAQTFQQDLQAAQAGDLLAQVRVGKDYDIGPNVNRNYVQAAYWFGVASGRGSLEASAWLGSLYMYGRGVTRDWDKGLGLIQQAANGNNPVGLRFAGEVYERGMNNYTQAMTLYNQAANLGDANSMTWLGRMYLNGLGVTKNVTTATSWFLKASNAGDSWGKMAYAQMLLRAPRTGVKTARALGLFKQSAAQGNGIAAYRAGMMIQKGFGTARNPTAAFPYLEQSAAAGFSQGQRALGHAFELGLGTTVNLGKAYFWYQLSAQQGDAVASNYLAAVTPKLSQTQLSNARAAVSKANTRIFY
jgi:TPR repeat protein